MPLIEVHDVDDPRLADFRHLTDANVRPDRRGVVIAEGVNVVERLLGSRYPLRAVLGVPDRVARFAGLAAPVYVADKWLLSEVIGFRLTRGVLAAASRTMLPIVPDLLRTSRRLAIVEGLNDAENLGALFRNAAAFGVDGVLLDPRTADPLYRRSVRVSMGHVLRVPFAVLSGAWPASLAQVRAGGYRLLALTPQPSAVPLRQVPTGDRWAVLVGAEGPGLSEPALAAADEWVRIPMAPGVDSLNVATAAAVAFAHLADR